MYSSVPEGKNTVRFLSVKSIHFKVCYYSSAKSGLSSVSTANLNYLNIIFKLDYYMPQFTPLVYNQLKLILQNRQDHRQATFWIKHTT